MCKGWEAGGVSVQGVGGWGSECAGGGGGRLGEWVCGVGGWESECAACVGWEAGGVSVQGVGGWGSECAGGGGGRLGEWVCGVGGWESECAGCVTSTRCMGVMEGKAVSVCGASPHCAQAGCHAPVCHSSRHDQGL